MEEFIAKDRRNSPRVPVKITAVGEYEGRRIAMYSENISRDGMFTISPDFVPPRSVLSARIWLSTDEEPLRAYLTSCSIERTWASYGIGVCISGISTADRTHWEDFYRCCVAAQEEQKQRPASAAPATGKRHLVVVDGALSPLAEQALRKPWLEVSHAASVSEALALVQERPTDVVLSDFRHPGVDGLALCRGIDLSRLSTNVVLLSEGKTQRDFLPGIHAGAALVIGKQCSHKILVDRILQMLEQRLPSGRPRPATQGSRRDLGAGWNTMSGGESAALVSQA